MNFSSEQYPAGKYVFKVFAKDVLDNESVYIGLQLEGCASEAVICYLLVVLLDACSVLCIDGVVDSCAVIRGSGQCREGC